MTKEDRRWPGYVLGGRLRTSTVALILAFLLVWWLYDVNQPDEQEPAPPSTFVVPPGFDPNPNYTWVPRTDVQGPRTTPAPTTTETTTPTESTTPTETTSPGSPPTSATTTTPAPPDAPPADPSPTTSR